MLIMSIDNLGDISLQNARTDVISFHISPEMVLKEIREETEELRRNHFISDEKVNKNKKNFGTFTEKDTSLLCNSATPSPCEDHLQQRSLTKMSSESAESDGEFKDADTEFEDSESASFEDSVSALHIGPSKEDNSEDEKSEACKPIATRDEPVDELHETIVRDENETVNNENEAMKYENEVRFENEAEEDESAAAAAAADESLLANTTADDSIEVILNPLSPPFLPRNYRKWYGGEQVALHENGVVADELLEASSSSAANDFPEHDLERNAFQNCVVEQDELVNAVSSNGQVASLETREELVESGQCNNVASSDLLGAVGGLGNEISSGLSNVHYQQGSFQAQQPVFVQIPSNGSHFPIMQNCILPSTGETFVMEMDPSLREAVPLDNTDSLSDFSVSSHADSLPNTHRCTHRQYIYGNFDPTAPPQLMPYMTCSSTSISSIDSRPSSLPSSVDGSVDYQSSFDGSTNYESTWYNPLFHNDGRSTPDISPQPSTPTDSDVFPATSASGDSVEQTTGQPFQYPAIYVSEAGLMTLLLKHDISLEMTIDRTLRLVSHQRKLVIATNNRGNSSTLVHPAVRVVQRNTTTDVDLFLGRRARMATDSIIFGNQFKNYKFDYKYIDETYPCYEDISKDLSVNLLFSCTGYGRSVVPQCTNLVSNAHFENFQHGGFAVHINGVKVIQNGRGDVSVISGPKFLRLSPSTNILRIQTHFIDIDVETNWNVKLRRGAHTLNASHLGMVVSNGKIEAGFDERNRLHSCILPRRLPLALGARRSRRPGAAPRRRAIRARNSQMRSEQERDHSGYTLPTPVE